MVLTFKSPKFFLVAYLSILLVYVDAFQLPPIVVRVKHVPSKSNLLGDFSNSPSFLPSTSNTRATRISSWSSLNSSSSSSVSTTTNSIHTNVQGEAKNEPQLLPIIQQKNIPEKSIPFLITLWNFTRPHTLIGSALAIPALHALAAPTLGQLFTRPSLLSCIYAMIPSLLMNLYITGLNQITDVEIDKINKPNLPIAAGHLSRSTAIVIVVTSLLISLGMGIFHPSLGTQGLNVALWGSMILGTLYSLPPFRLKRYPLLAAICIVAVRGVIINTGFYAHAKAAAFPISSIQGVVSSVSASGSIPLWSYLLDAKCLLSSFYYAIFGIVIALMKDVPDATGDALFQIRTFTVRIGQKTIFNFSRRMLMGLLVLFGGGFGYAATQAPTLVVGTCRTAVALFSMTAAWSIEKESQSVDPKNSDMVYKFYMHLWKIFYFSYLAMFLVR